jgi:hypothetical protein
MHFSPIMDEVHLTLFIHNKQLWCQEGSFNSETYEGVYAHFFGSNSFNK